jgi:hypothetical protein
MKRDSRRTVLSIVALSYVLAGCDASSVRRPLWKSEQYRNVITEYRAATVLPSTKDKYGNRVWNQPFPLDFSQTPIAIGLDPRRMGSLAVSYADQFEPHPVHPAEDYTSNIEVRIKGSTLYVYHEVVLTWTEYHLAVFDIANRNSKDDLLVAPEDMPPRAEDR